MGGEALAVKVGISKEEDTEMMAGKAVDKFGKIDILVNNAAMGYDYARGMGSGLFSKCERAMVDNEGSRPLHEATGKRKDHKYVLRHYASGYPSAPCLHNIQGRGYRIDKVCF